MDLRKITEKLISFRTETGNSKEIDLCLKYVEGLLKTNIHKIIYRHKQLAPVMLLSNCKSMDFDVLAVGHLDVVPADAKLFKCTCKNNKLYGRGTLDMKSFAAVCLDSLEYVIKEKLPLKFGVLLSTDEEKGSFGLDSFLNQYPQLKSKIVLDVDVAGDITKIITKCKNPVFIKITATGLEAHGSTPWNGIDANEKMLQVLNNIRKIYPYFSKESVKPTDTWVDTVHFAKIQGGDVVNVISSQCEALLDFRLTEKSSLADLEKNLKSCLVSNVKYEIISSSHPVIMNEKNPYIVEYKKLAEQVLGKKIKYEYVGGATDARAFDEKGSIIIMHSGSGKGIHASGEYVEWETVEQLAKIQKSFLSKLTKDNFFKN